MAEVGPPLAHFFPGLPPLRELSPREICAYMRWRHDAIEAKPDDGDDTDFDTDGAEGWDGHGG